MPVSFGVAGVPPVREEISVRGNPVREGGHRHDTERCSFAQALHIGHLLYAHRVQQPFNKGSAGLIPESRTESVWYLGEAELTWGGQKAVVSSQAAREGSGHPRPEALFDQQLGSEHLGKRGVGDPLRLSAREPKPGSLDARFAGLPLGLEHGSCLAQVVKPCLSRDEAKRALVVQHELAYVCLYGARRLSPQNSQRDGCRIQHVTQQGVRGITAFGPQCEDGLGNGQGCSPLRLKARHCTSQVSPPGTGIPPGLPAGNTSGFVTGFRGTKPFSCSGDGAVRLKGAVNTSSAISMWVSAEAATPEAHPVADRRRPPGTTGTSYGPD